MKRSLLLTLLILLPGCATVSSEPITQAPADWSAYSGQSVRLTGRAGNSRAGPILRLRDGNFIELQNMPRPFTIDEVARDISVDGTVVPGQGVQEGRFVVRVDKWWLTSSTQVPSRGGQ